MRWGMAVLVAALLFFSVLPPLAFSSQPASPTAVLSPSDPWTSNNTVTMSKTYSEAFVANRGAGTVSVINLSNFAIVSTITAGTYPLAVAISSSNAYVVNQGSNSVTVIGLGNLTAWTTISVGSGPDAIALSSSNAYVANENSNSVSVIGLANSTVWETITVGKYPTGVAISSSNVFVVNYVSATAPDTVSVIGLANSTVWKTITSGGDGGYAIAVSSSEIYVANDVSGSVSIIGLANYTLWKTVTVGSYPYFVALSSSNAYVANEGSSDVSIIGEANSTVWNTVATDSDPVSIAVSLSNAFIASYGQSAVNVLGLANSTVWKTVDTGTNSQGIALSSSFQSQSSSFSSQIPSNVQSFEIHWTAQYPSQATYDSNTYTASPVPGVIGQYSISFSALSSYAAYSLSVFSYTITYNESYVVTYAVTFTESGLPSGTLWYLNISGQSSLSSTGTTISTSLVPDTYSYTIATGDKIYAPSPNSGSFTITSSSYSNSVTFNELTYGITFTQSGLTSGTWYVNVTTTSQTFSEPYSTSSVTFSEPNGTYSYTISTNYKTDKPSPSSGSFTVNGAALSEPVSFSEVTYTVTFTESGLSSGTWYVNVTTTSQSFSEPSTTTSLSFNEPNGTYSYTIATNYKIDKPSPSSGSFTVNGAAVSESTSFSEITYSVTFTESGLSSGTWYLNVSTTGQDFSEPYTTSSISFSEPNGTYSYTVATGYKTESPSPSSSSFTVNGGPISQSVTFSPVTYTVTFTESTLPSGAKWYVNITGQSSLSSTGTSISIALTNGSYTYSIGTPDKTYSAQGGSFTVNGAALSETVTFTEITYAITFTESGLPSGSDWNVTLNGVKSSSTSTSISFNDPNGSYSYTVGIYQGYSANPATGTVTINGGDVSVTIEFTRVVYTVTFTESGLPPSTEWYVNITGQSSLSSTSTTITTTEPNGTYSYSIATGNKIYRPNPSTSSFVVDGATVGVSISFQEVTYAVTFTESGLPSSTEWYVNITSGNSYSSTTGSISFSEPNGSYSYSIATADKIYSPSPFSGGFTVNGATVSESVTFNEVTYSVTFTESGLPSSTEWYLNITGRSPLSSTGASISTSLPNATYTYTIATGDKTYKPLPSSSSFTVNGAPVSESITFQEVTYSVSFTESGLPTGATWNVTLNGVKESSATISISFSEPNGSYSYTVGIYQGYSASPYTSSVTVNGATQAITITFTRVVYVVTFTEGGLPSSTEWYLNITGQTSLSSTTGSISVNLPNGSYSYTIATGNKIYAPSPYSGGFTINGSGYSGSVTFNELTWSVTFTESGLPSSLEWYVNITTTGQELSSTSTTISVTEHNGTYSYTVSTGDKIYAPNSYAGSFTVNGATVAVSVPFHEVTYEITFTQTGLPSGNWYVNVSSTSQTFSEPYTTSSISFYEVNNSYSFTIQTNYKIYAPSIASGTFTVNGAAVTETVAFNEVTYAITFTESGLPSSTKWFVNITSGSSFSSTAGSITIPEDNGSHSYTIATGDKIYAPSPFSGSFSVTGAPVTESIVFSPVTYTVTFSETGLPAGTEWYLNISGQSSLPSTGSTITTQETNGSYAYTIATGNKIYYPNPSSSSFTVNGTSVSETVSFSELIYLVTFKETGLPSGVTWYVNVTGGGSYASATTSLSFHDPNGTYSFTATDNDNEYRASSYSGSFTVNGASINVNVTYEAVIYSVTFTETGLPSGSSWYVILNGSRESSNVSSITFQEFNGSYSFTVQEIVNGSYGKRYVDFSYTGSRNVTGKVVIVNVTYAAQYYLLESIIPMNGGTVSPLSGWYNSSAQVKINASAASSFIFESWSGTGSGSYSGQINPNTVTMNGPINETASFEKTYAIAFIESGLPSGIVWYLNVSGPTGPRSFHSSLDSITFHGPNGTYSYSLGTNTRYATSTPTGQIIVNGGNALANATFHLVTYTVDFIEIGLPSASLWSVSLNGTTSVPTNTSVISFTMPNGTYPYSVAPLSGVVIEPNSGNVVVIGQNVVVDIVFKTSGGGNGGNLVSFIESGLPANGEWFVTLNGYTESSFSSLIQFYVGNGTYPYSISTTSNAKVSPDFGNVTVTHNMEVTVIFSNSTSSPGSSTTTIVQKISDNLGLIIGSTAASIIIGWVLAIYVNPDNRKKRSVKRETRKGAGHK